MLATIYYLMGFLSNLACSGITLFLILSHEDTDVDALQPLELADYLTTFQKIEIGIWIANSIAWMIFANIYITLIGTPIFLYNAKLIIQKGYKENFMFMSEYKNRSYVEWRLTIKIIFYLIYVVLWLFMFVYKLAEYLSYH